MEIKQYQIVLVNLDPSIGTEMKKTRPAVIISPDEMNRYLQTIIIAPMTKTSKPYPTRIGITQRKTRGWIVLDQVRTIDRRRILKTLGQLAAKDIEKTKSVLREIFVD
jgi:mRNA interferase MazF